MPFIFPLRAWLLWPGARSVHRAERDAGFPLWLWVQEATGSIWLIKCVIEGALCDNAWGGLWYEAGKNEKVVAFSSWHWNILASACHQVSIQNSWLCLPPPFLAFCQISASSPRDVLHAVCSLMLFSYSWGKAFNVSGDDYHIRCKRIKPYVLIFLAR